MEQHGDITRLEGENERRERENAELLDRLLNLRLDTLVETAFTPGGLRDHLQNESEIQEELTQQNWGVLRLDGRFVNYINKFGVQTGDDFLEAGGYEITTISDGLVRTHERRQEQEDIKKPDERQAPRRQGHSLTFDIICRQGGDEFALLIRNVTPAQLTLIASRVESLLTVDKALERYSDGKVPFIASVGFAHASTTSPKITGLMNQGEYFQAFRTVSALADEGQRRAKAHQYDKMWELAVASMDLDRRPVTVTRPGEREVAETFLRVLCADFMRNPLPYLVRQKSTKTDLSEKN